MNKNIEIPPLPSLRRLYYKGGRSKKTLKDLIKDGFAENGGFVQTFTNSKYTGNQCKKDANRSFGDLLRLARTYFPKTTREELATLLYKLNEEIKLYAQFCHTVNKVVFRKGQSYQSITLDYYINNAYNGNLVGADKYSFNMIKQLAKK